VIGNGKRQQGKKTRQGRSGGATYDKTPINPYPKSNTAKQKRNLVRPSPQCAPHSHHRAHAIHHRQRQWQRQDVVHWELRILDQMLGDDLTHRVRVDESDVEDKGNEMVVQDYGLEVQVKGNEGPGGKVREEAVEGSDRIEVFGASVLHHVQGTGWLISSRGNTRVASRGRVRRKSIPLHGIEHKHNTAVDHVPLVPGHIIDRLRDPGAFR